MGSKILKNLLKAEGRHLILPRRQIGVRLARFLLLFYCSKLSGALLRRIILSIRGLEQFVTS